MVTKRFVCSATASLFFMGFSVNLANGTAEQAVLTVEAKPQALRGVQVGIYKSARLKKLDRKVCYPLSLHEDT